MTSGLSPLVQAAVRALRTARDREAPLDVRVAASSDYVAAWVAMTLEERKVLKRLIRESARG